MCYYYYYFFCVWWTTLVYSKSDTRHKNVKVVTDDGDEDDECKFFSDMCKQNKTNWNQKWFFEAMP